MMRIVDALLSVTLWFCLLILYTVLVVHILEQVGVWAFGSVDAALERLHSAASVLLARQGAIVTRVRAAGRRMRDLAAAATAAAAAAPPESSAAVAAVPSSAAPSSPGGRTAAKAGSHAAHSNDHSRPGAASAAAGPSSSSAAAAAAGTTAEAAGTSAEAAGLLRVEVCCEHNPADVRVITAHANVSEPAAGRRLSAGHM